MSWIDPALLEAFERDGTDAHRLGEGPGWRAERFGPAAILSTEGEMDPRLPEELDRWAAGAGLAIERVYARELVHGPKKENAPRLVRGGAAGGDTAVVRENGLSYEVDFLAGYSCGLFPDQRANRLRLRAARPGSVLNTFAYTCAFSVAAAAEGARTLSLDVAKAALARGRRNFELNGLDLASHRFIADDVMEVLPRLARRGERFDAVILDPPTFSRGRNGRVFQAERDLGGLLALAIACLSPGGAILLSTNCTALDGARLARLAREAAPSARQTPGARLPDIRQGAPTTLWLDFPR